MCHGITRTRQLCVVAGLLLLSHGFGELLARAEEPGAVAGAGEKRLVRMPVSYEQTMLVVVSSKGVAGVRFFDLFEKGNVTGNGVVGSSYEWRYLERGSPAIVSYDYTFTSRDGKSTQSGAGEVYETNGDKVERGRYYLEAAQLRIQWSRSGPESGWVYYDPAYLLVWNVDADQAEVLLAAIKPQ